MDSCSLFNFFFGTKKATRELSKCFSGLSQQAAAAAARGDGSTNTAPTGDTPPASPLRQLQMRLVNLATSKRADKSSSAHGSNAAQETAPSCTCNGTHNNQLETATKSSAPPGCGTYRATLVHSENEDDQDFYLGDRDELMDIDIVGNLSITRLHADRDDEEEQQQREFTPEATLRDDNFENFQNNITKTDTVTIGTVKSKPKRVVLYSDFTEPLVDTIAYSDLDAEPTECVKLLCSAGQSEKGESDSNRTLADKRNVYVRNLVRSFESSNTFDLTSKNVSDKDTANGGIEDRSSRNHYSKTATIHQSPSKPKPPKTPPKTNKAKFLNWQLSHSKPTNLSQLFKDKSFLVRFFDNLEPLDRCAAAQVCRQWRDILYANVRYWKDLIIVIDCAQLRREHLIEYILNTLQSARWKQQGTMEQRLLKSSNRLAKNHIDTSNQTTTSKRFDYDIQSEIQKRPQWNASTNAIQELDQEDVHQELCNRFSQRAQVKQQQQQSDETNLGSNQQQQQHETNTTTSKSSSIPSQISSTISSVSISSVLSPLSESSRVESLREKLYSSMDERAFEGICLFGASDEDIEDFVSKFPADARDRLIIARLNNCSLTNNGLESFITTFKRLEELELSGCNELTNVIDLTGLLHLKRLAITDCFNMADGLAQRLAPLVHRLDELTVQAYHLTDAFMEFLVNNGDTSALKRLELPNCKEITNQSLVIMAKYFPKLEALSISGSTKICDDGLEFLTEHTRNLQVLNLSWCTKVTDNSLERIASDLGETLTDLILDRNTNITNIGLGFLAKMKKLALLHIRWCSRISDMGLEAAVNIKSLRFLSLAGLHQITAGGLFYLIDTNLSEVELTNCPAANGDLIMFLSSKMPHCNIIY